MYKLGGQQGKPLAGEFFEKKKTLSKLLEAIFTGFLEIEGQIKSFGINQSKLIITISLLSKLVRYLTIK